MRTRVKCWWITRQISFTRPSLPSLSGTHTLYSEGCWPFALPRLVIVYLSRVTSRGADHEEIRRAYFRLALCLHPDKAVARHAIAQQRQDQVCNVHACLHVCVCVYACMDVEYVNRCRQQSTIVYAHRGCGQTTVAPSAYSVLGRGCCEKHRLFSHLPKQAAMLLPLGSTHHPSPYVSAAL